MMGKPKIRFKGYNEDWEQRKLGEVFEQTTNFVNLSKDDIELWSLTVEDGLTPKSERYNREFLVKKDTNFKEVRPGDIVYNPMNMTLGAVGYNGMSKSVAISGYYTTMITKDGNDSYYINTWLKSPQAISLYKIYATGSLIEKQRVQFPTLSTIPAVFPKYEEQHKIGCYFEAIDHLITLHHRKRVILKKTKVSDWEQRKFSELYKKVNEKNIFRFGVDKIISVANMYFKEDVKKPNDEYMRTYNIMRLGDIAFEGNKSKNFSHGRFVENTIGDGIVSHVFDVFRPVMDYDLLFWKYLINNENVMGRIMTRCTKASTMMTNLVAKDFLNENILVPTIEEQHKIGTYIDKLDHLITLHQHKCDELQNLKKYMLQNMFV